MVHLGKREIIISRHLLLKAIREWFFSNGFIEVQVPVLSKTPIPEATIDLFSLSNKGQTFYLLSSPELYLKPLLSLNLKKIFSITPAFRKEERGPYHLEQFFILEWYRAKSTYKDLFFDCEELLDISSSALSPVLGDKRIFKGKEIDLSRPFQCLEVKDAFEKYAGWDPFKKKDELHFYEDLAFKIEPNLPEDRPVFLMDYPDWASSLSKLKNENRNVCERFELYLCGIELANGFSELMDPIEQRQRFLIENIKREKQGLKPLPIPENFLSKLKDCPEASGIALGIDRLLMILTNSKNIEEVQAVI